MKILVLGGTQFIGRHVVARAVANGHDVTVLTRGLTTADLPASVERLTGDRNDGASGITALQGRSWDACIDLSGYTPVQVQASAHLLERIVQRYLFISTASVYDTTGTQPLTETNALLQPAAEDLNTVTNETYGPLKVTCENIVNEVFEKRATVLRPQIVAGPFDHTGRHAYWVARGLSDIPVAMPGDGSDYVQVIDARDLAGFAVHALENSLPGTFDVAGPRITWSDFARALGIKHPVWVTIELMASAGVEASKFPIYIPSTNPYSLFMNTTAQKALDVGLVHTAPDVTVVETRPWSLQQKYPQAYSAEEEARMLALSV